MCLCFRLWLELLALCAYVLGCGLSWRHCAYVLDCGLSWWHCAYVLDCGLSWWHCAYVLDCGLSWWHCLCFRLWTDLTTLCAYVLDCALSWRHCAYVLDSYMLSLPHSAGDSRNYKEISRSPAREKQSPAISSKHKWKKLREHPALSGFQSTKNKQIVRNLLYWVRIIGLFLAGHCLKCFSESPHNE